MTTFTCKEEGDQHSLGRILAPKYLGLKSSCSVMLLVHFSDSLGNCLIYTVRQIHTDSVDADFPMDDKAVTVNVVKHTFTTYDPVKKKVSAKRIQLPLKLSYGLTIHKSQGMNLDSVVVHCEHISLPGQFGVAVGRATNISGLQVIGLKKYHCKPQPTKVRKFYEDISNTVLREDLTCCCSSFDSFGDSDTDNSDIGDSDKDEIIGDIDIEKSVSMINDHDSSFSENDEDLVQLIDDMSHESSDILIKKNPTSFNEWFAHQHICIKGMAGSAFKGVETVVTSKQINAFYTKLNIYFTGEDFNSSVTNLLSFYRGMGNQSKGRQFLTCIMLNIQKESSA
jgi:hypothetical protein